LIKTAAALGYRLEPVYDFFEALKAHPCGDPWPKRPTLAGFTRTHKNSFKDVPVIVNVTRHYVVVRGRKFVDNNVKRPVPLKKAPGRRCRVRVAWRVIKLYNPFSVFYVS